MPDSRLGQLGVPGEAVERALEVFGPGTQTEAFRRRKMRAALEAAVPYLGDNHRSGGVWHKDGALAQVRTMSAWADREATRDYPGRETLRKIAANLRAAADALDGTVGADHEHTPRGRG